MHSIYYHRERQDAMGWVGIEGIEGVDTYLPTRRATTAYLRSLTQVPFILKR